MTRRFFDHWPEYLCEALCLALFMVSAAGVATLLQHPASPIAAHLSSPIGVRVWFGAAMAATLMAIVYSPFGARSGAHLNPAMTLTFLRLRKIAPGDAAWYLLAQFLGGAGGILLAAWLLQGLAADPTVNYIATVPGEPGPAVAFIAEAVISFGMMVTVLSVSNSARFARATGVVAGVLVAIYIVVEAPLSGMSMNPARTLGPAVLARTGDSIWIYFTAPPAGMLLAAECYVRLRGHRRVHCAKLHHPPAVRCIFNCGYAAREEMRVPA